MKTETRYVANDGAEFKDSAACLAHEALVSKVAAIGARLKPRPENDGCSFANGEGYLQQDRAEWELARSEILDIVQGDTVEGDKHVAAARTANPSALAGRFIGRLIDDCSPAFVGKLWYRLCCTDDEYREWGQPYYACNRGTGKQFEVSQ